MGTVLNHIASDLRKSIGAPFARTSGYQKILSFNVTSLPELSEELSVGDHATFSQIGDGN